MDSLKGADQRENQQELSLLELQRSHRQLEELLVQLRSQRAALKHRVLQQAKSIALLQEVATIANEAETLSGALQRVLESVCRTWNWPLAHAWLPLRNDRTTFVSSRIWYATDARRFEPLMRIWGCMQHRATDDSLVGRVLQTGASQWSSSPAAAGQPREAEELARLQVKTNAAFPILVGQRVAGVLQFFNSTRTRPREELLRGMRQLGTSIGRVVERMDLHREIAQLHEEEQRLFAQELHDGVSQQLTGLSMMVESCRQELAEMGSPLAPRLAEFVQCISQLQRQVRHLVRGLMPVEVDEEGLMLALRQLCERNDGLSKMRCTFSCQQPVPVADKLAATHIYHIAKEALHNALKHAAGGDVMVSLEGLSADQGDGQMTLTIHDNGVGINPERAASGMGMRIMRYRASLIGAKLQFDSKPGLGTAVRCTWKQPVAAEL